MCRLFLRRRNEKHELKIIDQKQKLQHHATGTAITPQEKRDWYSYYRTEEPRMIELLIKNATGTPATTAEEKEEINKFMEELSKNGKNSSDEQILGENSSDERSKKFQDEVKEICNLASQEQKKKALEHIKKVLLKAKEYTCSSKNWQKDWEQNTNSNTNNCPNFSVTNSNRCSRKS